MKFVIHKSKEWEALKAQGWITAHVGPGHDGVDIASMSEPPEENFGRHVWKGHGIMDNCQLCGCPQDHKLHA